MNKFWKFIFWAPRVAYDCSSLSHSDKNMPLHKLIWGFSGVMLLVASALIILLEGSFLFGGSAFVLYLIQGVMVMLFYNQYHNEYLP